MAKDMYADLEKIEARGKRKKEKSKGLFSSFGKKDEPEPDEDVQETEQPEEAEAAEPPKPAEPKPEPAPRPKAEPPKQAAPKPVPPPETPKAPAHPSGWQPPTGNKLRKAEEELLEYKRWLNKGFKSGMLSKEQCVEMVRKKEVELGLRPPE